MADLSFADIQNLVRAAIQKDHAGATYVYIRDCYEDAVVYTVEKAGGASDPSNGLYYRRPYVLNESEGNFGVTLGVAETVAPKREYQTVKAFTLAEFSADGGFVTYKGKVFEAGDYPDKGVAFTPAELQAIASGFAGVPNDLEHKDTILNGELGTMPVVKAMDGGQWLYGELSVPKWLHDLKGGEPIGVSLAFDANKRIVGNALTLNPRIKTAQVQAAFVAFAGTRGHGKVESESSPETAVQLGANHGSSEAAHPPQEKKPMKMKHALSALIAAFSGGGSIDPEAEIKVEEAATVFADPEAAKLKASLEQAQSALIAQAATAFTDGLVSDRKILPAQAEGLKALFVTAFRDDIASGGAKFSQETGALEVGDRVAALTATFSASPTHTLTQEQMQDAIVVFGDTKGAAKPAIVAKDIFAERAAAAGGKK